jgi:alkanesulfonate monooxygenase SsuD/methylene tetrahydromethanopterin reductase-like flavin-dependent oxidoreductase (luciferase family)
VASSSSAPKLGYRDVEFKACGVPRGGLAAHFEECLTAIRRLWTEDFVTMKGGALRTLPRELHGKTVAEADTGNLDRCQR